MPFSSLAASRSASSWTQPRVPAAPPTREQEGSSVAREFLKYAKMSPGERLREAAMKSMKLTEDQLQGMSLEQRNAIEEAIKEKIKALIQQSLEKTTGAFADIEA